MPKKRVDILAEVEQLLDAPVMIVFAIALVPRLARVFALNDGLQWPDARGYNEIALNLVSGRGLVSNSGAMIARAPLYPVYLAFFHWSGMGIQAARMVQAFISAAVVFPVAYLGDRLFSRRAGRAAALMVAACPTASYFAGTVLTESLYTLLLACAMAGLVAALESPSYSAPWLLLSGLCFGLGALTRPSQLLLLPFLLPFALIAGKAVRPALAKWVLVAGLSTLCLLPWAVRNYRACGHVVFGTLKTGESLWEALGPSADGGPGMDRMPRIERADEADEWRRDRIYRREALSHARQHPWRTARLAVVKALRFWNVVPNAPGYRGAVPCLIIGFYTLLVYGNAAVGCIAARRDWRRWVILLAPALYFGLLHSVFVGSIRYREPVMPFLTVLAGYGIVHLMGPRKGGDCAAPSG